MATFIVIGFKTNSTKARLCILSHPKTISFEQIANYFFSFQIISAQLMAGK
jgi:hypothetical protein